MTARLILTTCALLVHSLMAGLALGDGPPALDRAFLASMPGDADLIVVVNDAASQLDRAPAQALVRLLGDANLLTEPVRQAWSELGRALGWDERQAFDELLGHRFAFFVRYAPRAEIRWGVLTLVDDAARSRIVKSLSLAVRETAGGRYVTAGEGGGFKLALGPSRGGWSGLLLARAESSELFEAALPQLAGARPDKALGDHGAFAQVGVDLGADAIILINDSQAGSASITAISATAGERGYTGHVGIAWSVERAASAAQWSPAMLGRLDDGAIAAFLGVAEPGVMDWWRLRLPELIVGELASLFETRFGGRVALVVEAEEGAVRGATSPTLAVTGALETNDVYRTCIQADMAMSKLIPSRESLADPEGDFETPDYMGELYESVRVEPLEGALERSVASAVGPTPTATWVGVEWGQHAGGHEPPAHLVSRTGWWCVGLACGGVDGRTGAWPVRRLGDALRSEGRDERPTLRSLGVVRPRRFYDWLTRDGRSARGQLGAIAWIEEIRWSLAPKAKGALEGDLSITFSTDLLGK